MARARCEQDDQRLYRLLKALGNPVRLQIVRFIEHHPHCIGNQIQLQLPDHAARAQSTLSQHLKILRAAEVLQAYDDGAATCYVVNRTMIDWLRAQLAEM